MVVGCHGFVLCELLWSSIAHRKHRKKKLRSISSVPGLSSVLSFRGTWVLDHHTVDLAGGFPAKWRKCIAICRDIHAMTSIHALISKTLGLGLRQHMWWRITHHSPARAEILHIIIVYLPPISYLTCVVSHQCFYRILPRKHQQPITCIMHCRYYTHHKHNIKQFS